MPTPQFRMVYSQSEGSCLEVNILIKRKIYFAVLLLILNFFSVFEKPAEGKTFALIISGIIKDEQYRTARTQNMVNLQEYLLKNTDTATDTIKVLLPDETGNNTVNSSQYSNVQKLINNLSSTIKPEDRFVFYYTGQANVANQQLRFNLPDKDITQLEMGQLIKSIKSKSMLVILDCPAAGLAVKELSAKGRIIICSCTDQQRFNMKFGECFMAALNNPETDIDNDNKKSILEVFISTSKNVEDWYREEKLLLNETPVLDDDGDGKPSKEPWLYSINMKDGLASSKFFLEKE